MFATEPSSQHPNDSAPDVLARRQATTTVTGERLVEEVRCALTTLQRLDDHSMLLGDSVTAIVRTTLVHAKERLERNELRVAIAGESGSGKSTFVDALIGARLLGGTVAARTAVVVLRHSPTLNYRAKFASGSVENFARRVPDRSDEITGALWDAESSLVRAQQEHTEAAAQADVEERDFASLHEELSDAELAAARAGETNARALDEALALSDDSAKASAALLHVESKVPKVVRSRPAWWALWLWLFWLAFVWLRRETWRQYLLCRKQRDEVLERVHSTKREASASSEAFAHARAHHDEIRRSLEIRSRQLAAATARRDDRDAALRETRARVKRLRAELTEHGEARRRRFHADLTRLLDGRQRSDTLAELAIDYPTRLLPEGLALFRTPVMSDDADARQRGWELIREADGCILLSDLDRAVSRHAKQFLEQLREVVPHVLLVLTKIDHAFANAVLRGGNDPSQQIEQARRIGTRRFAREVGREPDEVLSICVSAEAALNYGDNAPNLQHYFEAEVDKLFRLLTQERALMLGARTASLVRRCVSKVADAELDVERAYERTIATLEAHRTPEPDDFRHQQLEAARDEVAAAAASIVAEASARAKEGFGLLRVEVEERVRAALAAVSVAAGDRLLEQHLTAALASLRAEVDMALETRLDRALRDIESRMFDELGRRYQLIHEVRREASSLPRLGHAIDSVAQFRLAPLGGAVSAFRWQRGGLGIGGALAGALIGTTIVPGLGTLIGAVLGLPLCFLLRRAVVERRVLAGVHALVDEQERELSRELLACEAHVTECILDALDRSLDRVIARFGKWLAVPIEAERQVIARERAKLADLQDLERQLERHDARLQELLQVAKAESIGLCQ